MSAADGGTRLTEKDKIKVIESFRLGDVVKALVVRPPFPSPLASRPLLR